MDTPYHRYKDWQWRIPSDNGQTDLITLHLGLFGKETLRLNGEILSQRNSYSSRSEYSFSLSDGREAALRVSADWQKRGLPQCELVVGDTSINPSFSEAEPTRAAPALTAQNRIALIAFEIYLTALFVLIPLWVALFTDNSRLQWKHVALALGLGASGYTLFKNRRARQKSAREKNISYWEELHQRFFYAIIQNEKPNAPPKKSSRAPKLFTTALLIVGSLWILIGEPLPVSPGNLQALRLMAWLTLAVGPITFLFTYVYDDVR